MATECELTLQLNSQFDLKRNPSLHFILPLLGAFSSEQFTTEQTTEQAQRCSA